MVINLATVTKTTQLKERYYDLRQLILEKWGIDFTIHYLDRDAKRPNSILLMTKKEGNLVTTFYDHLNTLLEYLESFIQFKETGIRKNINIYEVGTEEV